MAKPDCPTCGTYRSRCKCLERKVPASNFVATVASNVDNEKLTDAEFREFIRNTLPIVEYDEET